MLHINTRLFAAAAVSAAVCGISPVVAARSTTSAAAPPAAAPSESVHHAAPEVASPVATNTMTVISGSSSIQTAALTPEADKNVSAERRYVDARKAGGVFELGLETLVPHGSLDAAGTVSLSDATLGAFMLNLGYGYKFSPRFSALAAVSLGSGLTVSGRLFEGCEASGVECSSALLRYNASVRYTVNPRDYLAWWISAGIGRSHLGATIKRNERKLASAILSGNEVVFKTGVNFAQSPFATADVYFTGSLGSLSSVTAKDARYRYDFVNPGIYSWFGLGVGVNL